ncbi:MAG: HNH endonuclease [Roseovarius sp.]|nr:HNH endonuclease [Roseovarius sp.]
MLDNAVFKKLAHNDTGAAVGHQGGIVIPKGIAKFFPPLPDTTSPDHPTADMRLVAELLVDGQRVATVETRYQCQTWGGTRPAEHRLTDNLGPLRTLATADDIVLFAKDLSDDSFIQMHLFRKGTPEYRELNARLGKSRWGPVDPKNPPVSTAELKEAERYLAAQIEKPASPFDDERGTAPVLSFRRARDRAFRNIVLEQYGHRCAFTRRRFVSPVTEKTVGLDAAHVVPVHARGSDHPANGLPLTKDLHWAFDRGLVGVGRDRRILVPDRVAALEGNEFLRGLHGNPIEEARTPAFRVHDEALEWHRDNVLLA